MRPVLVGRPDNLLVDEEVWSIGWTEGVYVLFNHDRPEAELSVDEIKSFIEGRG